MICSCHGKSISSYGTSLPMRNFWRTSRGPASCSGNGLSKKKASASIRRSIFPKPAAREGRELRIGPDQHKLLKLCLSCKQLALLVLDAELPDRR